MARTDVSALECKLWNEPYTILDTELIKVNGEAKVRMWEKDYKYVFVLKNETSADITVTFEDNESTYGVGDYEITVPATSTTYIQVESAKFKRITQETDKNYVYFTTSGELTISIIRLP